MDTIELLNCKLCGSANIVRFGRYRGIQRWWCKDCRHKFAENDALPDMRTPSNQVAAAIDMYFEGTRLNTIPRLLFRQHGTSITSPSIFRWITHFSRLAIENTHRSSIHVGDSWIIVDTVSRNDIKDTRLSLVDILDLNTYFLLATGLYDNCSQYDIEALMQSARQRAGKAPREILTDGWKGYLHGIELFQEKDHCPVQVSLIPENRTLEIIKYWYRISHSRTKIIQGLKKKEAAQLMLNGWSVHYNYISPHGLLGGKTPGGAAAADCQFRNWLELIRINQNLPER
jgi:transposase-like protein